MKILLYDMGSYTFQDLLYYLKKAGHTCKTVYYHFPDKFEDEFFCHRLMTYLREEHYDVVFSINFFPLVAQICHQQHIKYISWSYDSPLEDRLQEYFSYETNYIFLFDRTEALQYQAAGYDRVYHLPLAVNAKRLSSLSFSKKQIASHQAEVSFVGQLYDSPLDTLISSAGDYSKVSAHFDYPSRLKRSLKKRSYYKLRFGISYIQATPAAFLPQAYTDTPHT